MSSPPLLLGTHTGEPVERDVAGELAELILSGDSPTLERVAEPDRAVDARPG